MSENKSLRARINKIEKSLLERVGFNPDNISGVLAFLKSGDEAKIPEGVSFLEVQAAAQEVWGKDAAQLSGLSKVREALGDKCKGNILDYLAAKDPGQLEQRVVYLGDGEGRREIDSADSLLSRLGFQQLFILVYQTRPQDGQEAQL